MLASRFHPDAREELLEAGQYILNDNSEEGLLFKLAFAESLDWACSQPLIFRCFKTIFAKSKSANSATR
jgi:hypothetical protein